jgi:hypothetical protein
MLSRKKNLFQSNCRWSNLAAKRISPRVIFSPSFTAEVYAAANSRITSSFLLFADTLIASRIWRGGTGAPSCAGFVSPFLCSEEGSIEAERTLCTQRECVSTWCFNTLNVARPRCAGAHSMCSVEFSNLEVSVCNN